MQVVEQFYLPIAFVLCHPRALQGLELLVWEFGNPGKGCDSPSAAPFHVCCSSLLTWPLLCRCLVEKGDVAFMKHPTVLQNTDGRCLHWAFLLWSLPGRVAPQEATGEV